MQYKTLTYEQAHSGHRSPLLHPATIESQESGSSKYHSKLPSIFNSNKILMMNLIRQENRANHSSTKNNHQSPLQTIQSLEQVKERKKGASQSSVELVPKVGKIMFNKNSPLKLRRKYLITCPSDDKQEAAIEQRKGIQGSEGGRPQASRNYSRRRLKNSLHLDKNSYSILQVFDRMESLKRLFDSRNYAVNRIRRIETEGPPQQSITKTKESCAGKKTDITTHEKPQIRLQTQRSNAQICASTLREMVEEKISSDPTPASEPKGFVKKEKKIKIRLLGRFEGEGRVGRLGQCIEEAVEPWSSGQVGELEEVLAFGRLG